jgi:NADH dehydrogenase
VKVVVVGAGFGGLTAVRELKHAPVEVTLVDAKNFHLFQPLLYQVATAGLDGDDIAYPVRGVLRRQRNAQFRLGRVVSVDLDEHTAHLEDGTALPYDVLVVAVGTVTATFGVPGVKEHAFGLKTLSDAMRVRNHILGRFEHASARGHVEPGDLDVVIVGGGPTGVELAGGIHELYDKVLARDFPDLDVRAARITVIELTDRVLGTFAPALSDTAAGALRRRNVALRLGTGVARIHPDGVELEDGTRVDAKTIIWTAGVRPSPFVGAFGLPTDTRGRVRVGPDLRVEGQADVFAIGDVAGVTGQPTPQVAQAAIQGGKHVAKRIAARLDGRTVEPFRYVDRGSMATIGRNSAVAQLPAGLRLTGVAGWLAWLVLHLVYLIGFRNRANVLVNWAWNYVTYDRGARLLGEESNDQLLD